MKEKNMFKNALRLRSAFVFILGFSLLSFSTFAQADGDRGEKSRHGHYRHHHHDGRWYTHDEVVAPNPPSTGVTTRMNGNSTTDSGVAISSTSIGSQGRNTPSNGV